MTMAAGGIVLLHKMPNEEDAETGDVVVTWKDNMGENWNYVKCKEIHSAKLRDYIEKCGPGFNRRTDNCVTQSKECGL